MNAQLGDALASLEKTFVAYTEALVTRRMAAAIGADPDGVQHLDAIVGELGEAYNEARMNFRNIARPLAESRHAWAEINFDLDELLLGRRRQRLRAMAGEIVPKDILPIDITLAAHRERLLSRLTPARSLEGGDNSEKPQTTRSIPTGAEVHGDPDPGW